MSIYRNRIYQYIRKVILAKDVYKKNFAIGIFMGDSYGSLDQSSIINPVLTAKDVSDVPAVFVADPFMIKKESTIYMFFEVLNTKSRKGEIGLAKSDDWFNWKYEQIVLSEPFHLSYPYVFEWENNYYMIPETGAADEVRLYRADDFPKKWSYICMLIRGGFLDASIFIHNGKWWLFAAKGDDTLHLFFADNLMGPWQSHPKNPIINENPHIARPGGRVVVADGQVIRFAQDDSPKYALKVHAFQITEISTETYEERKVMDSLLGPSGTGWNAGGMHHIDPHQISENQWLACVDGWGDLVKAFAK